MNLVSLASHTVDLDLLPEAPIVLDAGCRWFDFTTALQIRRKDARVIAIDPAQDVVPPVMESRGALPFFTFMQAALVGTGRAQQRLAHFSTGEGDFLTTQGYFPGWDVQPVIYDVECFNIGEIMLMHDIKHFDLVKLDIEGSEFGVLENWPGPIATQISVEFHDWQKPEIRDGDYYERLMRDKLPQYRLVQHALSQQGSGVGYWDSLICLK